MTGEYIDDDLLERALAEAHLPSLLVTLVQLQGDASLLRDEWRPKYVPYTDGRTGGLPESKQAEIRAAARRLIRSRRAEDGWPAPQPTPDLLRKLMSFVAGATIHDRYLPLLQDELGLEASAASGPAFDTPGLRAGARKLKVLVIGAGMSGLLAGIKLKQAGISFEIIERNADVGGTWFENVYPGCRVDSQNHIYCYSFAPNHDWPQHYSTQDVLLRYFKESANRFELRSHIRFNTSVESARFDESSGKWQVRLKKANNEERDVVVDAVISAVGQLNMPKIPEYEDRETFRGPQFHSARWRSDVDLRDKRVAVVGTGASAFQMIPKVAAQCRHLTVFQRSAPWFAPTFDYHYDVGEGQKWLLKNLPFYANWYRFWLFWTISDGLLDALKVDPQWKASDGSISASNQRIRNALVEKMKAQIGDRLDLVEKVVPRFAYGGKRTLRDNGQWIETLKKPHVELVSEGIDRITPNAIITNDGVEHAADVIVYGTGFHASRFLEPMKIFGRAGVEIGAHWSGEARAYLGMTVPDFPNFFCIYGPNTNLVAQGSIVFFSECSMRYILGCLKLLVEDNARSMEPRQDIHDAYNLAIDEENNRMAWGIPGISNWYKSASGRVSQNWPFPLVDYWNATRAPNREDFIIRK